MALAAGRGATTRRLIRAARTGGEHLPCEPVPLFKAVLGLGRRLGTARDTNSA